MNGAASEGAIPANVSESDRAIVTAGLANDVDVTLERRPASCKPRDRWLETAKQMSSPMASGCRC